MAASSTTPSCIGTATYSATRPRPRCGETAAMLKAIHAGEDIEAARQKAVQMMRPTERPETGEQALSIRSSSAGHAPTHSLAVCAYAGLPRTT